MSETDAATNVVIVDAEGLSFSARLEPVQTDVSKGTGEQLLLHLDGGAQFLVPTELLVPRADGRYDLRLKLREYAAQTELETEAASETTLPADTLETSAQTASKDDTVISLAREVLSVGKRTVEKSRVQLRKYVTERSETVDVPLTQERVAVERVKIGQPVDEAVPVRYEGDTAVVPVFEEVLVVSKQLMLVEEVRITTQRTERREPQQVTLRREEVSVERSDDETGDKTERGDA